MTADERNELIKANDDLKYILKEFKKAKAEREKVSVLNSLKVIFNELDKHSQIDQVKIVNMVKHYPSSLYKRDDGLFSNEIARRRTDGNLDF